MALNYTEIHNVEEKLKKEAAEIKGSKERVVQSAVTAALISFCKQENEFAQAILESKKSFKDCLAAVVKGVGSGISDLEAYRRAVQFYFPGADIEFKMTIDLCASVKDGQKEPASLSLMDLL